MINSLTGSIMNMKCDIYTQQNSQTSSGAIQRSWVYHTTIDCRIEPIKGGKSVNTADNKSFDKDYEENLELKLKSATPLSKRYRITAIKSNNGEIIYKEIDRYNILILVEIKYHFYLTTLS
jgi:hypothetical protein